MKSLFEFGTISGGGCGGLHMDAKSILMVVSQISACRHHLHPYFLLIYQFLIEIQPIEVAHTNIGHPVRHFEGLFQPPSPFKAT